MNGSAGASMAPSDGASMAPSDGASMAPSAAASMALHHGSAAYGFAANPTPGADKHLNSPCLHCKTHQMSAVVNQPMLPDALP